MVSVIQTEPAGIVGVREGWCPLYRPNLRDSGGKRGVVSVIQTEPGRIVGVERGGVRYTDRTCGIVGVREGWCPLYRPNLGE